MAGTLGLAEDDGYHLDTTAFDNPARSPASAAINPVGGTIDPVGVGAQSALGPTGERKPIIDGKKNPLGAIGAVLMNINRGMTGQPLYTTELRKQQQEEDLLELKRTEVGASLLEQGTKLLQNTPSANREAVAKQFGALYEHLVPGFSNILKEAAANPAATADQIAALGDHAKVAIATFGGVSEALKGMAAHPEIVKQWDAAADKRNAPYITHAFDRVGQILKASPDANQALQAAAKDGWTLSDLADPEVAGAMGLDQSMIGTIRRDPDLQRELSQFGFIPTEDQKLKAQEDLKQTPLSRVADEANIKAQATANAKPMNYIDADGNIKAGTFGDRERMAGLGYQPVVTGRTQQDIETNASRRVTGKQAGERESLIDPFVASITGTDPNTTNQQFIDKGGNPTVDATTTRSLQESEAAFKSTQSIIGNVKSIVEANPDANTRVASLERVASNLTSEYEAFTRASGFKSPDLEKEAAKYKDVFEENGIDNALLQQAAVSLAYMTSSSFGQSGHSASDKDVANAAKAIGTKNQNPKILTRLLDQAELNFDDSFRNKIESVTRVRPPSSLPDVQEAEAIMERRKAGEKITPREITDLSPRALLHLKMLDSRAKAK